MKRNSVGTKILLSLLTLVFIPLGAWIILLSIKGEFPVDDAGKQPNPIVAGVFGAAFCLSGLIGFVFVWVSDCARGIAIKAGLMTAVVVIAALIPLSAAILAPDEITVTQTFNNVVVSRSQSGWIGVTLYSLIGVLPIIFVRQIYRCFKSNIAQQLSDL